MATKGVPDEVGMMITDHHTKDRYGKYDQTQNLKMEAAVMVSSNSELDYESAITTVSKKFISEQVMGTTTTLKPLIDKQSAEDAAPELTGHNKDRKLKILSDRLSGQATIVSMKQPKEQSVCRQGKFSQLG